jgi:hypothetical protein
VTDYLEESETVDGEICPWCGGAPIEDGPEGPWCPACGSSFS